MSPPLLLVLIALLSNGTIIAWGANDYGQTTVPNGIQGNVTAISAGSQYSMTLQSNGQIEMWGDDTYVTPGWQGVVRDFAIAIAAGGLHSMALFNNGTVYVWGANGFNQTDVPEAARSDVTTIAAGADHCLALLSNGTVVAWGRDLEGQTDVPATIQGSVTAIAGGGKHSLALLKDGTVVGWGADGFHQTDVPPATDNVIAIAAGQFHSLALVGSSPPSLHPAPVLAPPPQAQPPTVNPLPPVLAPSPPQPPIGNSGSQFGTGKLVGIILASSLTTILVVVAAMACFWHRRKQARHQFKAFGIHGLTPGEVFTRATAHEYRWCDSKDAEAAMPLISSSDSAGAIELTQQQVQQQILLVKDGLLGRGATALVFKCIWSSRFGKNALLAAKVLKDGYESDISTLQSFCYEATVLSSLNPPHDNVVRLYGYCLEPPTVCLILELLPGSLKCMLYREPSTVETNFSSLNFKIKQPADTGPSVSNSLLGNTSSNVASSDDVCIVHISKPDAAATAQDVVHNKLSMLQVLQVSLDVAAGLKYLHDMPLVAKAAKQAGEASKPPNTVGEAGPSSSQQQSQSEPGLKTTKVVHRDLKPANILISADGRAKISDFGLARQQLKTTMMTEHLGAGTLPYMAPELLVGMRVGTPAIPATNRVDIYSMAMIMWEMLAGCPPWSHMNEPSMLAAVMSGRRPELPMDQDTPMSRPLSETPASVHAMPEFNAIIRAC